MFPFPSSSPIFIKPTLGFSIPNILLAYIEPKIPNSNKFSGLQSEFAPTSNITEVPHVNCGTILNKAGLLTSGIFFTEYKEETKIAPVLPALAKPSR